MQLSKALDGKEVSVEVIEFSGIESSLIDQIKEVFSFVACGKRNGSIDEENLSKILGDRYFSKFIHTKEESDAWLEKWKVNRDINTPWDYGSWVDSLISSEVELVSLKINSEGEGKIIFNQLVWPTGGIEALEELINVFDGKIVSNNAI